MAQPRAGEAGSAGLRQHAVNIALVLRVDAPANASDRPQVEVEQAIAEARLVVVIALGCAVATISIWRLFAEAFVDRANLRLGGLRVR